MSKVDIKRLDSVTKNDTTATEQINDNFQALQAAIENTVSRDGTVPNYMDADLDLNSYRIINAAAPVEGKDVVTLEYFEEKAGGAIEAAAEAKASASKAASSAQSALVASNNAIGQLAQAEGLLIAAEGQLEDTKQFVNAAKSDIEGTKNTAIETINNTVSTAKSDINTAVDEAKTDISNIVSDAEGSITNIAVTEANKAIANAAQEATDIATANLNSYVDGTVKPSLQTYVDQAQADANSAATSMEQAALSATAASNYASNASADADNAAESATHAATFATDSEHYSEDSRIWAEGTDSEVQGLGGVHSSKVWSETAQEVVTGKQDIATAVNYNNITNCITEIPQDIKLELKDGILTLKAGSKVYVPNGFEADGTTPKFDEVVVESDVNWTASTAAIKRFGMYATNVFVGIGYKYLYSGSTTEMNSTTAYIYARFYNTDTNKIYAGDSNGGSWVETKYSLPICIFNNDKSSSVTSIDRVFNGFGYIGSTAFALPGVKGLIPNGRNADGSLKNIEFTVDTVITRTITWNSAAGQELFIGKYKLNEGLNFISTSRIGQYFQQDAEPTKIKYAIWYKPTENKVYRCVKDSNGNLIWIDTFPCYIGQWFTSATSPYPITKLTIRLPFHAVDYNDFKVAEEKLVTYGIPAGTIIAWSTGIAPAGYLICDGSAVSRTTYAALFAVIGTTYGAGDGNSTFNLPNLAFEDAIVYSHAADDSFQIDLASGKTLVLGSQRNATSYTTVTFPQKFTSTRYTALGNYQGDAYPDGGAARTSYLNTIQRTDASMQIGSYNAAAGYVTYLAAGNLARGAYVQSRTIKCIKY